MELKPNYTQCDLHQIPEAWSDVRLGDIGESLIGLTYSPSQVKEGGLLVLRSSNVAEGNLKFEDNVFVDMEVPERIMVRPGDILICVRNGSQALIGKCAKIDADARRMTFGAFMAVFRTPFHEFVFHQFQSDTIKRQIHAHLGATINQITNASLNSFRIPLPDCEDEQRAISTALSDVDALIGALDKLIAKKRGLKQAAMQQLLTGRTRLPGFTGEWEKKAIGDGIDLLTGFPFPSTGYVEVGVRLLRGSNVKRSQTDWREDITQCWPSITPDIARYELREGDLVIAMDGSLVGRSFARLKKDDLPALLLQRVARIRSIEKLDIGYLTALVSSDQFVEYSDSVKTITAIPHISPADIRNFTILAPPTLEEQSAIATVLSDMDAEIAALEARRDKTRALKQGMMQELLTGRTRLV